MSKVIFKIASPIIITGFFVIMVFLALNAQTLNNTGFLIVFALLVVYIFLFGFATGQQFARPLKQILRGAMELSEGNIQNKIMIDTKDEFGELARILNKISDNIEESRVAMENAEKSVDVKVKARTRALEETIDALEQKVKNRTIELQKLVDESERVKQSTQNIQAQTPPAPRPEQPQQQQQPRPQFSPQQKFNNQNQRPNNQGNQNNQNNQKNVVV